MLKWLILILGIATNAGASVMVKIATLPPRRFPSFSDPGAALTNWPFWLGLVLYAAAFFLYAAALARLPLNVAHPILTSGAIATVSVLAAVLFRETFYWTTVLGIVCIIAGVFLITVRLS
jgi:multidrug transporter EmrE-like cation transporter